MNEWMNENVFHLKISVSLTNTYISWFESQQSLKIADKDSEILNKQKF